MTKVQSWNSKKDSNGFLQSLKVIPAIGILLGTLSGLFSTSCSMIVKVLPAIPPMDLLFYMYALQLVMNAATLLIRRKFVSKLAEVPLIVLSAWAGWAGVGLGYAALRLIPIGDASAIILSSPIFVSLFARILLREPSGLFELGAILSAMVGVVLICRPSIIFGSHQVKEVSTRLIGSMLALSSACLTAVCVTLLRKVQVTKTTMLMTMNSVVGVVAGIIYICFEGGPRLPSNNTEALLIFGLASVGLSAQLAMIVALKLEHAAPVALARTFSIVAAFAFQVLVLKEQSFVTSFIGAAIVFVAVVGSGLRKWYLQCPDSFPIHLPGSKNGFDLKDTKTNLENKQPPVLVLTK